jgi:hypothetical protein
MQWMRKMDVTTETAAADVTFLRVVLLLLVALSLGNALVLFALL